MADHNKTIGPTKQWDNPKLLTELCVALYQALEASGGLTSNMKDAIPAYLQQQDMPMTWSAIRQHIQKLRKTRDTNGITGANGGSAAPTTPSSTKKTKEPASKKRSASAKKSKAKAVDDPDEVDALEEEFNNLVKKEQEMDETPSKKVKRESADA